MTNCYTAVSQPSKPPRATACSFSAVTASGPSSLLSARPPSWACPGSLASSPSNHRSRCALRRPGAWRFHRCTPQSCPARTSCHRSCSSAPCLVLCHTCNVDTWISPARTIQLYFGQLNYGSMWAPQWNKQSISCSILSYIIRLEWQTMIKLEEHKTWNCLDTAEGS